MTDNKIIKSEKTENEIKNNDIIKGEEAENKIIEILKETLHVEICNNEHFFQDNKKTILIPKYSISFLPINNYEQIEKLANKYFEIEDNQEFDAEKEEEKANIIEKLNVNLNDLKFKVDINNIEYTFTFNNDKILKPDNSIEEISEGGNIVLQNNSTKEKYVINYNKEICFIIFNNINIKKYNIYKKNGNGISIINIILKNIKDNEKLCNELIAYIEKNNIKINKYFIEAICEAGNIYLFKHYFNNATTKELFNSNKLLAAACFGGEPEIIHILEEKEECNEVDFNVLETACAGEIVDIVDYLLTNNFENLNFKDNEKYIINLFKVIKNPEIVLYFLETIIKDAILDEKQYLKLFSDLFFKITEKNHIISMLFLFNYVKKNFKIDLNKLRDNNGDTLLHTAVKKGSLDIIKFLFYQKEVKLCLRNNKYKQPLDCATENKNSEVIKFFIDTSYEISKNPELIKDGAIYNILNKANPLYYACKANNFNIVKYLLSLKDLNLKNMHKIDLNFILCYIISKGDTKTFKLYIDKLYKSKKKEEIEEILNISYKDDINFHIKDIQNNYPLQIAIENKNLEIINLLLSCKEIHLNSKFKDVHDIYRGKKIGNIRTNYTLLYTLIKNKEKNLVKPLLDNLSLYNIYKNKTNIKEIFDIENNYENRIDKIYIKETPLHALIDTGNINTIKLFIDKLYELKNEGLLDKEDIEKNLNGITEHRELCKKSNYHNKYEILRETPLHYAIKMGNTEVVRLLLSYKEININIKPEYNGKSPLHYAIETGNIEIINLLLSHKEININEKDKYRETTLNYAIKSGNLNIFNIVIKNKKIDMKTNLDENSIRYAIESGNLEIFKALLSYKEIDANSILKENLLHHAARVGNLEMLKILLSFKGTDINSENSDKETLLHCAVKSESLEIVKLLLSNEKIDVNIKNNRNKAPLHNAIEKGNAEIVRLLLSNKEIDVNIKGHYDETPLHNAIEKGNAEIVRLLLSNKEIDVNVLDYRKETPIFYAVIYKKFEIIKLLLENKNLKIQDKFILQQLEKIGEENSEIREALNVYNTNLNQSIIGAINNTNDNILSPENNENTKNYTKK